MSRTVTSDMVDKFVDHHRTCGSREFVFRAKYKAYYCKKCRRKIVSCTDRDKSEGRAA